MRSLALSLVAWTFASASAPAAAERPNVVWIVTEDISPSLGCYGDPDAITPNLDRLAGQGVRFNRAFTHAPVCAPTRSGLITGMYPTTIGSHHMRSKLVKPPGLFTDELKKAGYAVFWPGKTDFNFDVPRGWADTRDWTRNPAILPRDRPFFAFVNIGVTHEGQVRATPAAFKRNTARLKPEEFHDPAKVKLPPYYPDHPDVRRNVATYHDNITAMDHTVGDILKTLDDLKLSENTVVFFFGDHGWGMPRGKRWCYDSGTRAPLIVRWPGKLKAGTVREDPVAFLDLPATVLSVAGVEPPARMQGQVVFGEKQAPPRKYVFSNRDRMDEAYDRVRSVRSERYRYIRNFHPELPYAQWLNYADEMPTLQVWRRQAFEGKLNPVQAAFFARTKPPEEFYDLANDPYETKNLAGSAELAGVIDEHRKALDAWIRDTHDMGGVPETEMIARGLVRDVLTTEYKARIDLHPKTPPVP
ncbi:MAG: sulfatase [Isosphaeraceae bacterium]